MNLLYDMPLYRPPSEADNLIIQATLGCSFNQCSFCCMYRSKQYIERPFDSVFADIREAAAQWPDAHRVFLADGDALALPTDHLLAILRELAAALPRLARVSCYATPSNIQRKSAEELALLREHKLILYNSGFVTQRPENNMGFNITLLPENHTFTAKAGETIMEAAKKHGHNLPLGCADGACGLCKGSVLQGTVDHGKSTVIALPAEDREAGFALFCCAKPTSDLVIERREMVSDWTTLDWNGSME